ncbi:hypothetical protein GGR28_003781 [Lewinella aquimaris]|uniref:Uncharacterized protein n=1 Tax=Neolewinella aquimaris TaxID=1835722 RepID=A0A840E643_9BACT|nr:hypothetical protein [Neolewinella aquimaris]MBB4081134.1 hypothetical protein [Neolewinella aquimaris]
MVTVNNIEKANQITNIWNRYIYRYKFFGKQLQFTDDIRTNYFGEILTQFHDMCMVLDQRHDESASYGKRILYAIGLLQAIYVQQDLIEEIHIIFKTGVDKQILNKDENYVINRNIRNETVGHPIRKSIQRPTSLGPQKQPGKNKLLSSTLFVHDTTDRKIVYGRYHRDSNFKMEAKIHFWKDVSQRHNKFIESNLDFILKKIGILLENFGKNLIDLYQTFNIMPFNSLVTVVERRFEKILLIEYVFDPLVLNRANLHSHSHPRYQNVVGQFYKTLEDWLTEEIQSIEELIGEALREIPFHREISSSNNNNEVYNTDLYSIESRLPGEMKGCTYDLGKLVDRNHGMWEYFYTTLKSKCINQDPILNELEFLRASRLDEFEYCCSFFYIERLLKETC